MLSDKILVVSRLIIRVFVKQKPCLANLLYHLVTNRLCITFDFQALVNFLFGYVLMTLITNFYIESEIYSIISSCFVDSLIRVFTVYIKHVNCLEGVRRVVWVKFLSRSMYISCEDLIQAY
ncbi:hypothetical protein Hdeb2414_s0016g00494011 [Helianthus debilis subsp. tardiflorus]